MGLAKLYEINLTKAQVEELRKLLRQKAENLCYVPGMEIPTGSSLAALRIIDRKLRNAILPGDFE